MFKGQWTRGQEQGKKLEQEQDNNKAQEQWADQEQDQEQEHEQEQERSKNKNESFNVTDDGADLTERSYFMISVRMYCVGSVIFSRGFKWPFWDLFFTWGVLGVIGGVLTTGAIFPPIKELKQEKMRVFSTSL